MKVSTEQLLQFIGQLYVENQVLLQQVSLQESGIRVHMDNEHPIVADPEPEVEGV